MLILILLGLTLRLLLHVRRLCGEHQTFAYTSQWTRSGGGGDDDGGDTYGGGPCRRWLCMVVAPGVAAVEA